jgi:hypothetical protein
MKVTYWDLRVGEKIENTGRAMNAYEIISMSEKKICMRRLKDGMEHCMDTARALDMINRYYTPQDTQGVGNNN